MQIKFCEAEGCHEVAVGISRWDRDKKPESRFCRPDYLERAELVQCEVVGDHEITDAVTNAGVGKGGIVTLDVLQTNLAQLVYGGHIKVVPPKKAEPKSAAPKTPATTPAKSDQD